jgi:hypothetical protein
MAERRKFFKATTIELTGPHYGGLTYLPGTHHALGINDPFDSDPDGWCTAGLYVTSHRRVAARWGQVVIEVLKDAGAKLVKTNQRHKPLGVPSGIDSGSYAKYRTTGFKVIRVVGVVGHGPTEDRSQMRAKLVAFDLNMTLKRHGLDPVQFTGVSLERLRDDGYRLWEVLDPNAVIVSRETSQRPPRVVKHRVEIEFEALRQLQEDEIYSHMGHLQDIYPGSQRIVSMR